MEYLLQANSVSKKYGDFTALNNVSIAVEKGAVFGLLGPNGAGKTSLIRIINQITMPDSGAAFFGWRAIASRSYSKHRIFARGAGPV